MARSRRRRWLLITIALLLLGGGAAGAYYVFKVARTRTSPYQQALALQEAGNIAGAEEKLRSILEANPSDIRSRLTLIDILDKDARNKDAVELAAFWLDDPKTEALGLQAQSRLALYRGDIATALRLSRMVADREPVFSQQISMQVHDAIGSPGSRERSAQAAETLAGLVKEPEACAGAWLYAAETLTDVSRYLQDGQQKESLLRRSALDREKARDALRESVLWKERYPEGKSLMARVDLLSDDSEKQSEGLAVLSAFVDSKPSEQDPPERQAQSIRLRHEGRMALVRHLIGMADYGKATEQIRLLRGAPGLFYVRALSSLALAGERALVLTLVDEGEVAQEKMLALIRARILIQGEGAEREEGIQAFEKIALDNKEEEMVVRECFLGLRAAGELDRALALLDQAGIEGSDLRMAGVLDRAVRAIEAGDTAAVDTLLGELAGSLESGNLLPTLSRLSRIEGGGAAASLQLMDQALASGKGDPNQIRLWRALVRLFGGDQSATDREAQRELAKVDLATIADDESATRPVLLQAANVARIARATELIGRLLGRALVLEEEAGDPVGFYVRGCATVDGTIRQEAAKGMRSVLSERYQAWLSQLADALALGDGSGLRRPSSEWAPSPDAPQPTEALLQFALAVTKEDKAEAEAYARKIISLWPERNDGKVRLGAILLRQERYDEVLPLHEGSELSFMEQAQRIDALRALGRLEEAVAEARALSKKTNGSDQALMILARLQIESDPNAALAAVSQISARAPRNLRMQAELLRGQLLEGRGDLDSATQIYNDLLLATGRTDLLVWQRLARARSLQGRDSEFIRSTTALLENPPAALSEEDLARITMLRGLARERIEDYERALEDYRHVLRVLPKSLDALNNAAWLIHSHIKWRPSERPLRWREALALVTEAANAAPGTAPIFHTRAQIHQSLEMYTEALADYDHATEIFTKVLDANPDRDALEPMRARRARYLLDKAGLLEAMDRPEDARAIYQDVSKDRAGTTEGRKADIALQALPATPPK